MSDGVVSSPPPAAAPSAENLNSAPSESSATPHENGGPTSFAARVTQGFFENLGKATEVGELFESTEEGEEDDEKMKE